MEFQKAAEDTSSESRRSCLRFLQRFAWWSEITIGSIEVAGWLYTQNPAALIARTHMRRIVRSTTRSVDLFDMKLS